MSLRVATSDSAFFLGPYELSRRRMRQKQRCARKRSIVCLQIECKMPGRPCPRTVACALAHQQCCYSRGEVFNLGPSSLPIGWLSTPTGKLALQNAPHVHTPKGNKLPGVQGFQYELLASSSTYTAYSPPSTYLEVGLHWNAPHNE